MSRISCCNVLLSLCLPVHAASATGSMAVFFEPAAAGGNAGATYIARTAGMTTYVTAAGATTVLHKPGGGRAIVRMTLENALFPRPARGLHRQAGVSHYYAGDDPGDWRTGVPHFGRVEVEGVYQGIDMIYHGGPQYLEYDFVVAPGSDPSAIRMRFEGGPVELSRDGHLLVRTEVRELYHRKPSIFQTVRGQRIAVDGNYRIAPDGSVRFHVGAYRKDLPLIIDPVVTYSTYLGGSLSDEIAALVVSGSDVIVAGSTDSAGFGTGERSGETDAFLSRLDAAGNILYTVLLGGEDSDFGSALALNAAATEVILAGSTRSAAFPGTAGSFQSAPGGGADAFVTRFDAITGQLIRSTRYGGSELEDAKGVAVSSGGSIVLAGNTFSSNLPLANPTGNIPAPPDGYLARFSPDLTTLEYGTYFGGAAADFLNALALDNNGRAVIGGQTYSNNFPVQAALQAGPRTLPDGFVARVNLSTGVIVSSTYIGGSAPDSVQAVAVDGDAILAAGFTQSADFPSTAGSWSRTLMGGSDVFGVKLSGPSLIYGTLIGGSGNDRGTAIAAGPGGAAALAVSTLSTDFPTVAASQIRPLTVSSARGDVAIVTLDGAGNVMESTYHSGTGDDSPLAIAYGSSGRLFAGGRTGSLDFPLVAAADPAFGGFSEGFVAAFSPGPAPIPVTFQSSPPGRRVIVDDVTHTAPVVLRWLPGVTHRIDAEAEAFEQPNHTFVWSSWNGLPSAPRQQTVVTPAAAATYTANFDTLTCTYEVTPATAGIALPGGAFSLNVLAPPQCPWSARSNSAWIHGGAVGRTGNGVVTFTADVAASARTGSVVVAFRSVSLVQAPPSPSVSGVSPASGTGASQTFTFTFQHPGGALNLGIVNALINNAIDGRQACYLAFVAPGTLVLVNDAGDAGGPFAGTMALPGSGSISNSACTVHASGSSVSVNGNILALTLNIEFKAAFAGNRLIYQAARDTSGSSSGWTARGVWRVPGGAAPSLAVAGASPSRASGDAVDLTISFTSTAGFENLKVLNILINNAIDGRQACYLAVVRPENALLLVNDAGDAGGPFAGSTAIAAGGATVANTQCSIDAAGSIVIASGTNLTLTLSLSFLAPFQGDRIVYAAARNIDELSSGWQPVATITVPR